MIKSNSWLNELGKICLEPYVQYDTNGRAIWLLQNMTMIMQQRILVPIGLKYQRVLAAHKPGCQTHVIATRFPSYPFQYSLFTICTVPAYCMESSDSVKQPLEFSSAWYFINKNLLYRDRQSRSVRLGGGVDFDNHLCIEQEMTTSSPTIFLWGYNDDDWQPGLAEDHSRT